MFVTGVGNIRDVIPFARTPHPAAPSVATPNAAAHAEEVYNGRRSRHAGRGSKPNNPAPTRAAERDAHKQFHGVDPAARTR
jgi:hypothetical protein